MPSALYSLGCIACYLSGAIFLCTDIAAAFVGPFVGLANVLREHVGAGLILVGGCCAMLKTAAERGRLQGKFYRTLNVVLAAVGAALVITFQWAAGNGVPVRTYVFWPVTVLNALFVPLCLALATIAALTRERFADPVFGLPRPEW